MKTNEELMQLIDSAEKLALRSCTSECVINFEYMAMPECTCGTRDNNANLEAIFAKIREGMRLVPEALQPSGDVVSVAKRDLAAMWESHWHAVDTLSALQKVTSLLMQASQTLTPEDHELRDRIFALLGNVRRDKLHWRQDAAVVSTKDIEMEYGIYNGAIEIDCPLCKASTVSDGKEG